MKYRSGIKTLLLFTALIVILFSGSLRTFASDYQYKILDPKYNPAAENLVDGTIPPVTEVTLPNEHKGFDFGRFFAILAVIAFPMFIISLAAKTFKEITEDVPGRIKESDNKTLGNITIPPSERQMPKESKTVQNQTSKVKAATISQETKQKLKMNTVKGNRVSSPVNRKNPMLLNTVPLTRSKGLCLVEYNQKYSLIGYINDKIFLLNQFKHVNSCEIRPRLSESVDSKDRYIVRIGEYKALVEVSDSDMNVLLEL